MSAVLQHVKHAFDGEKAIRLLLFSKAVKKDGQVMVKVQLFDFDLPLDAVTNTPVLNRHWQITALVEASQLGVRGVVSNEKRTGFGCFDGLALLHTWMQMVMIVAVEVEVVVVEVVVEVGGGDVMVAVLVVTMMKTTTKTSKTITRCLMRLGSNCEVLTYPWPAKW